MTRRLLRYALTAAGAGILLVPLGATAAQASPGRHHDHHSRGPVVVVSGLNNPRQLSLVDGVELLVAEAGKGGPTPIQTPEGPGFLGTTGSISVVWFPRFAHGQAPHRIVTGLLSSAEAPDGSFAVGPDGVSARSLGGPTYIQETFFPPDAVGGAQDQNGKLLELRHRSLSAVADITGFEVTHDPDGHGVESNPYAVLALHDRVLVADAAANAVLSVNRWGHVRVFHVFGNVTTGACADQQDPPGFPGCNFVPTSLATDRHGNVYVGGLSSLVPGEAQVVKLDRSGRHVLHRWGGFTSVTGLAVGRHGTLYVSQLFADEAAPPAPGAQGVVTRIDRWGHRTNMDVPFPAGLALDRHGNLYVSAFSVAPEGGLGVPGIDTSGQVWRVRF